MSSEDLPQKIDQIIAPDSAEMRGVTEPLWTVDDVAQYLRLQPSTVRSMAKRGKLPAIKIGKVWRFRSSTLKKSLQEG